MEIGETRVECGCFFLLRLGKERGGGMDFLMIPLLSGRFKTNGGDAVLCVVGHSVGM